MNSLQGILREEQERLKAAEESYRREIAGLPKGSVQVKEIKGIPYAYLVYRKGPKVVSEYLGRFSDPKVKHLGSQIEDRRKFEEGLKKILGNQREVKRMIRGKR